MVRFIFQVLYLLCSDNLYDTVLCIKHFLHFQNYEILLVIIVPDHGSSVLRNTIKLMFSKSEIAQDEDVNLLVAFQSHI